MQLQSTNPGRYRLDLTLHELSLLSNAVNEVVNGVDISDAEFATRLGAPRDDLRGLLRVLLMRKDGAT